MADQVERVDLPFPDPLISEILNHAGRGAVLGRAAMEVPDGLFQPRNWHFGHGPQSTSSIGGGTPPDQGEDCQEDG